MPTKSTEIDLFCTVQENCCVAPHHGEFKKTLLLTCRHNKAILELSHEKLKHGEEFLKFVLWADESKVQLFGDMDASFVWGIKGQIPQLNIAIGA